MAVIVDDGHGFRRRVQAPGRFVFQEKILVHERFHKDTPPEKNPVFILLRNQALVKKNLPAAGLRRLLFRIKML